MNLPGWLYLSAISTMLLPDHPPLRGSINSLIGSFLSSDVPRKR